MTRGLAIEATCDLSGAGEDLLPLWDERIYCQLLRYSDLWQVRGLWRRDYLVLLLVGT